MSRFLPRWWRRSRWSLAWRCCDWRDHGRCELTPERCNARCVHVMCMYHPGWEGD
jgi:hypothetical protein